MNEASAQVKREKESEIEPVQQEQEVPQIDWPVRTIDQVDYENLFEDDDFNRTDSGVGESVSTL